MTTFNVGPAKVYPVLEQCLPEAYKEGILSMPHRSQDFMNLVAQTVQLLKDKLRIPSEYTVLFASSATECWEVITQSLTVQKSYHIYSGNFGERWFNYTQQIKPDAEGFQLDIQEEISLEQLQKFFGFAERRGGELIIQDKELICFTQNETSNGSQMPIETIQKVKEAFPQQLIAIDATSSMAGVNFDWHCGDIWYASVQKCFGLPAGLAVLVLSERAIARIMEIDDRAHYNSLAQMYDKMQKNQTTHTPNVLGIYLLKCVLAHMPSIEEVEKITKERAHFYYQLFNSILELDLLIKNERVRSDTVIAVKGTPNTIQAVKEKALAAQLLLGNGYGPWKETTFRIANFPAITEEEVAQLKKLFL